MKVIATYSRVDEAHFVRAYLEGVGIAAHLRDELTVTTDWALSNAVGGIRLEVADEDFDTACQLLKDLKAAEPPAPPPIPGTRPPHRFGRYVKIFFAVLLPVYLITVLTADPSRPFSYVIAVVTAIPIAVAVAGIFAVLDW